MMKKTRRSRCSSPLAVLAVIVSVWTLAGCQFINTPTAKGPKSGTAVHVAASPVRVESRNGSVEIVADPARSDVQIDATVTCAGDTQQEADQRLADASLDVSRDTSHALIVKPVFPGGPRSNDGASFVIHLPDAAGVDVKTSNGAVIVRTLSGKLVIDTSNASIKVTDHNGPATLSSSNGSITVTNLNGDLQANTSNASVTAHDIKGKATIDTSNGSIDLVLNPAASGPIVLDTSNASIKVLVGKSFLGDVSLKTSNASVRIAGEGVASDQISKTSAVVHMGAGGANSTVKSSNANIEFAVTK